LFANYVEYEKKEVVKQGTKSGETTPTNLAIFKLINRGMTFTEKETLMATQNMIETLQNDNFVVPGRFLEALSPEVDEFQFMYELSTSTEKNNRLSRRLLSRYNSEKAKRYKEYLKLQNNE